MSLSIAPVPARRGPRFSVYELSVFGVVAALLLVALIGPFIAPASIYTSDMVMTLMPPSATNWLGTEIEGYVFCALVYWIFCFAMSRYSMHLERKLHTGHQKR